MSGEDSDGNRSERQGNKSGRSRGSGSPRPQSGEKPSESSGKRKPSGDQRRGPRPKPSESSGSRQASGEGRRAPNRRQGGNRGEGPQRRERDGSQRGRPTSSGASGGRDRDTAGRRPQNEDAGTRRRDKPARPGDKQPAGRGRDAGRNEPRDSRKRPQRDFKKDKSSKAREQTEKRANQPSAKAPPVADDVAIEEELDAAVRRELRSLPRDLADRVASHLVMANRLAPEDPDAAYEHAAFARTLASRLPIVREASGLAAYHSGQWSEALTELRAARRMSGHDDLLPVLADCERGLGRPSRAVELVRSQEHSKLDPATRVELWIVESGARRDLGEYEAALVALQGPQLHTQRVRPWTARLLYAYADALLDAGRPDEARDWFSRALNADTEDQTDAGERLAELDGLECHDVAEDEEDAETTGSE